VGAVCGNPARTDLSGGRSAMDVPTAIEPLTSAVRLQCSPNRLTFERPSNLALCSDAGQTSQAHSGGRHFDLRPGAKDSDSLGQEAVAMDLRRRSKNRVVEAMARIVALLPIGQEPARPNCDVDIDRVDSVPEGCNESVKPLMQRVSPFRIAMANFFDDGFDLDQGGRREEQGVLMSLDPASEGASF
jgi:hypothetical protein